MNGNGRRDERCVACGKKADGTYGHRDEPDSMPICEQCYICRDFRSWLDFKNMKQFVCNPFNGTDGQLMVMAAHRYCLERETNIVGSCCAWMRKWWDQFTPSTRNFLVRDTIDALQQNRAGAAMDREKWHKFAKWAWAKISDDDKDWCREQLAPMTRRFLS